MRERVVADRDESELAPLTVGILVKLVTERFGFVDDDAAIGTPRRRADGVELGKREVCSLRPPGRVACVRVAGGGRGREIERRQEEQITLWTQPRGVEARVGIADRQCRDLGEQVVLWTFEDRDRVPDVALRDRAA